MKRQKRAHIPSACILFAALAILAGNCFGQGTVSMSLSSGTVVAGDSVTLSLSLNAQADQPSSLQWTASWPYGDITSVTFNAGPAAISADKTLQCKPLNGSVKCVLTSQNAGLIGNGVIATATVQTTATASSSALINIAEVISATATGSGMPATATGSTVTLTRAAPSSLFTKFYCASNTITGPAAMMCAVVLNDAAPAGSAVTLSSNSPNLTVPASYQIPVGNTWVEFPVSAAVVAANTPVQLTASFAGKTLSFAVTIVPPAAATPPDPQPATSLFTKFYCASNTITGPSTMMCAVVLNDAAPAGSVVTLSSTSAYLTVPASYQIAVGNTWVEVPVSAAVVATNTTVQLTATFAGKTLSFAVTINPPAGGPALSSLSCGPASLTSGASVTCAVMLTGPAPAGGTTVGLSSSSSALPVPASIQVAAGGTSTSFTTTAGATVTTQTAAVTATLGAVSRTASITITSGATVFVSGLACGARTLIGGGTISCTASLTAAASAGLALSVQSNSTSTTVPASVVIPSGATSVAFSVSASISAIDGTVQITASLNGSSKSVSINTTRIAPAVLSCAPNPLKAGALLMCMVQLNVAAQTDVALTITSSHTDIAPPPSATVKAGQNYVQFASFSKAGAVTRTITMSAAIATAKKSTNISLIGAGSTKPAQSAALQQTAVHTMAEVATRATDGYDEHPAIESLANAASKSATLVCSRGAAASLSGSGLAPSSEQVDEVRVLVNGSDVPVLVASRSRVDFECPDLPAGTPLEIALYNNAIRSNVVRTVMSDAAPGILAVNGSDSGYGLITLGDTSTLAAVSSRDVAGMPARPGDVVTIMATGLNEAMPLVRIGGLTAEVIHYGRTQTRGVFEVTVRIPRSAELGSTVPVVVETPLMDGRIVLSNVTALAIAQPDNQ